MEAIWLNYSASLTALPLYIHTCVCVPKLGRWLCFVSFPVKTIPHCFNNFEIQALDIVFIVRFFFYCGIKKTWSTTLQDYSKSGVQVNQGFKLQHCQAATAGLLSMALNSLCSRGAVSWLTLHSEHNLLTSWERILLCCNVLHRWRLKAPVRPSARGMCPLWYVVFCYLHKQDESINITFIYRCFGTFRINRKYSIGYINCSIKL